MEQSNQKKVLVLLILCMIVLLISSSYAIMTNFTQKDDAITFTTGNLEMTILNGEETFELINLNNRLPESDESGLARSTVIPITLKNTGTMLIGEYTVKLINNVNKISTLSEEYIRFSVSEDNIIYSSPSTLTGNDNIIFTGKDLEVEQTKTIYLKIWLSEEGNSNIYIKDYYASIQVDLFQFVEDKKTGADTIINKYGTDATLVAVNTAGTLYDSSDSTQTIREYRYSGATANNYVFFDTNSNGLEDDNEIWRIIGVFKNDSDEWNIKLMRNTLLTSSELPDTYIYNNISYTIKKATTTNAVYWNYTKSGSYLNDWTTAGLQYYLNGIDGYYGNLASKVQSLIDTNYTYYLGNHYNECPNSTWIGATTVESYTNERKNSTCSSSIISNTYTNGNCSIWYGNKATWNGKVALLYPSDYGYSASSSYWNDITLMDYNSTVVATSWMYKTANIITYEWLLSPSSFDEVLVARIYVKGFISGDFGDVRTEYYGIRPVLNLLSTAEIDTNHTGSSSDPYIILE